MSHQEETSARVPAHVLVPASAAPLDQPWSIKSLVQGQGTVGLTNPGGAEFTVAIFDATGANGFMWTVAPDAVYLAECVAGSSNTWFGPMRQRRT